MATGTQAWTEEFAEVAGAKLQLVRGGAGDPLLILHDEMGHHGQVRYQDELAQDYAVHIPSHPGFGATEGQEWIMNMRDMAGWYLEALDDLNLGPVNLLGFSLGGWLAAEMAAMSPDLVRKLVLVAPAGIRPGQRTMAGTRHPPSQLVFFSPRNGVMPASGQVFIWTPLSVE